MVLKAFPSYFLSTVALPLPVTEICPKPLTRIPLRMLVPSSQMSANVNDAATEPWPLDLERVHTIGKGLAGICAAQPKPPPHMACVYASVHDITSNMNRNATGMRRRLQARGRRPTRWHGTPAQESLMGMRNQGGT